MAVGLTESGLRRSRDLDSLGQPFDLVVVGGGINGCGIAWEEALHGLRVLLVEREDIGSGTSSWSSRLRSDYEAALRLIRSGRVDVSQMVTHRFPLAEVNAALDSTANGEGIKAALVP